MFVLSKPPTDHLNRAANLIFVGRFEPELPVLLDDIIGQRQTKQLLEELLLYSTYHRFYENTEEQAVHEALDALESLMPIFSLAALVLMARLFSKATEYKVEYVSNSVIVWILRNKSPELKKELEVLAAEEPNQEVCKSYLDWVRVMPVTDGEFVGRVASP